MKNSVVKEHYELLRLVVDHGAYPVLVVDPSNVVQMTNPAADRLLGQSANELVGQVFPFPIEAGRSFQKRHVQAEDGSWTAEMHVERTDLSGRRLYVVSLRDTSERALLNGVLEETRLTDDLTGLLNAKGFLVLVSQQMKLARRTGSGLLLLLADVDGMSQFNRKYGRPAGDLMLRDVGMLIRKTFRDSDLVARVRGDEFAMAAIDAHRDSGGVLVARLRDTLWEFNAHATERYQLSVSTGLVRFDPEAPCTCEELLGEARVELQENRRQRGRVTPVA